MTSCGHLRSHREKAGEVQPTGIWYANSNRALKSSALNQSPLNPFAKEHDGAHDQHERDKYFGDRLEALVKADLISQGYWSSSGHGARMICCRLQLPPGCASLMTEP